ncbi:MAG TPA: sugar phosphate isomerase/epimerase, partial [Sphingobium sp.]|nr:sugar phosphate isomerase/epimerase [Sphingobium sp.]
MAAPQLIATCWTTAGDVRPDRPDNLGRFPLEQRIEAAARAGYAGTGFWLGDLLAWEASGRNYASLKRLLDDAGQTIVELEYLADWFAKGERRARSDRARVELFRAADALEARHIKVMPPFLPDDPAGDDLAGEFAALCAQAADHGVMIGLEMLPFSMLPNLGAALEMVAAADAANGGLLIDIWHVMRSGGTMEEVADLPARFIIAAELCDATMATQGDITEDTMRHRKLCGEGEFDVPGFIGAMGQAGYDGPYGVE